MEKAEAIQLITGLIQEADKVRSNNNLFDAWQRKCRVVLDRIFGEDSQHAKDLMNVNYTFYGMYALDDNTPHIQAFNSGLDTAKEVLQSCIWEIETFGFPAIEVVGNNAAPEAAIETICNRFHAVVRQLRIRHDNRATLDVADEYDVQDLLHAILSLYFDDIRSEEWTPSYAGRSSRMDFLLKNENIVIETKKTRQGLDAKKVGEELIIDIARYQSHEGCKTLICFVYDPENLIANPAGLESDLSRQSDGFNVKVLICPKN